MKKCITVLPQVKFMKIKKEYFTKLKNKEINDTNSQNFKKKFGEIKKNISTFYKRK